MIKIFKKTIFILFIIFISVNFIYAENSTDFSDNNFENDEEDINVENTSVKTFTDLSEEINKSDNTVDLNESYKFDNSTDNDLINGSEISKNLTVKGHNNASIDGAGLSRGFVIQSNCSVVFKNIIFKNFYSELDGGAIYADSESNLTLINCTFLNNRIYNSNGASIFAYLFTNIYVDNCTFVNNTAIRVSDLEWDEYKRGMGSAFCVGLGSNLTILDSIFKDNDAYVATVLLVSYNEINLWVPSDLRVRNCYFENNTSNGGGIIYLDELGQGEVNDTIFRKNKMTGSGGTLVLDACLHALVNNCLFDSNSAVKGGGIEIKVFEYDYRSNVTIQNSNFTNNFASDYGGALYAKYGLTKISNCNFIGNKCVKGGAIYAKYASINIKSSNFSQNSAQYGGALFLRTDNNNIVSNSFNNNYASQKGGAVYSKVGITTSSGCRYTKNIAPTGNNVYGIFNAQLSVLSSYYSGVKLIVKLSSPWKMPLSQSIKLTFKGSKNYKTGWLQTNARGIAVINAPFKINTGRYSVKISIGSGICNNNPVVNVIKAPAKLTLSKTTKCNFGKQIKFHVKNSKTNNYIALAKLKLKIYTGKKHVTYNVDSDSNGMITFDSSKITAGKHKVKITSDDSNVDLSSKKYVFKIKKAKAKISAPKKVKSPSKIKIKIINKNNKNPIKKHKFKVKIYKKYLIKTVKIKSNSKGIIKISTKNLFKGKYKLIISLKSTNYKTKNKCKVKIK